MLYSHLIFTFFWLCQRVTISPEVHINIILPSLINVPLSSIVLVQILEMYSLYVCVVACQWSYLHFVKNIKGSFLIKVHTLHTSNNRTYYVCVGQQSRFHMKGLKVVKLLIVACLCFLNCFLCRKLSFYWSFKAPKTLYAYISIYMNQTYYKSLIKQTRIVMNW